MLHIGADATTAIYPVAGLATARLYWWFNVDGTGPPPRPPVDPRSGELGRTLFAPLPPSDDGGWNGYGSHNHDHSQIPWDEVIVQENLTHAPSRKKPDQRRHPLRDAPVWPFIELKAQRLSSRPSRRRIRTSRFIRGSGRPLSTPWICVRRAGRRQGRTDRSRRAILTEGCVK
jgi:hypothetical protein